MGRGAGARGQGVELVRATPTGLPTHTSFRPLRPEFPPRPSLTHPVSWDPAHPAAQGLGHWPRSWETHTLPSVSARGPLTLHGQLGHRAAALCGLAYVHGVVVRGHVEHRQPALRARLLDEVLGAGP